MTSTTFEQPEWDDDADGMNGSLIRDIQFPSIETLSPTLRNIECYEGVILKNIPTNIEASGDILETVPFPVSGQKYFDTPIYCKPIRKNRKV